MQPSEIQKMSIGEKVVDTIASAGIVSGGMALQQGEMQRMSIGEKIVDTIVSASDFLFDLVPHQTIQQGQFKVARAGHYVTAESGSTINAEPGAKVTAEAGAAVVAMKGADVTFKNGSFGVVEADTHYMAENGSIVLEVPDITPYLFQKKRW